ASTRRKTWNAPSAASRRQRVDQSRDATPADRLPWQHLPLADGRRRLASAPGGRRPGQSRAGRLCRSGQLARRPAAGPPRHQMRRRPRRRHLRPARAPDHRRRLPRIRRAAVRRRRRALHRARPRPARGHRADRTAARLVRPGPECADPRSLHPERGCVRACVGVGGWGGGGDRGGVAGEAGTGNRERGTVGRQGVSCLELLFPVPCSPLQTGDNPHMPQAPADPKDLKPPRSFDGKAFVRGLGTAPGVYRMYAADDSVLYVGKAGELKKRVASYFNAAPKSPRTQAMLAQVARMEVTVTRTETEALLLENQLIKSLKPRYNVLLR